MDCLLVKRGQGWSVAPEQEKAGVECCAKWSCSAALTVTLLTMKASQHVISADTTSRI